jgi:3-methylcrotonyl-CoA carboxylase alpha subunit
MFDRILIANRGEIACRVIETAKRLGVRTVAVYSEADADARHVRLADEAYPIGAPPAADSYLRGDAIIEVARHAGAQAVHPGYGFLSENAGFAEACAAADVTFIGPPPQAIRAMGAKDQAKLIMADAGVPVVPGYHKKNLDIKVLSDAARKIGYPVLVKAVAGGGGRGMRSVAREVDLADAVASARREAQSAFGDDRVLIEKLIARPRHIEVQIFADTQGNVVHLFERDCSVQRRHQKVIEEAPAATITPEQRKSLGDTAIAAARAIGYVGAGTVEFIADPAGNSYFMEMNTRLQVEHGVTEMVTGVDLVEWQLRVAAGEPLPLSQDDIRLSGHAIETRLYAEDPANGFLPATGRLVHMRLPAEPGASVPGQPTLVRVDTGVATGDEVTPFYDAMIGKLMVWGKDRASAVQQLSRALGDTEIVGPTTNLGLLIEIVRHPSFVANDFDTGFIEQNAETLFAPPGPAPAIALAISALYLLLDRQRTAAATAARSGDPHSPWAGAAGWRLNDDANETLTLIDGDAPIPIPVRMRRNGINLTLPDGCLEVSGQFDADGHLRAVIGGIAVNAGVVFQPDPRGGSLDIMLQEVRHRLLVADPLAVVGDEEAEGGHLTAPMPGQVTQILAKNDTKVARGTPLIVIEAMKMEHTISAPADGRVERIKYAVGDWVDEGVTLVDFVVPD